MYIRKPGSASGALAALAESGDPAARTIGLSSATGARLYSVPAVQEMIVLKFRIGYTQPKSKIETTSGRASSEPAPAVLEALRKPQPPPAAVSNGTTTLWVTSMTESTTPPAPQ